MKVCSHVCVNNYPTANNNRCALYSRGLQQDTFTPSFTGLKKSAFKGLDFAVVEKFKAPIEKFKSIDDFYAWAEDEFFKIISKDYGGRSYATISKRADMVSNWEQELTIHSGYTPSERLIVMDGMTKDLKPNDDTICPVTNRKILDETLAELKQKLAEDNKYQFDFCKMYRNNLRKMYIENANAGADESKWIIIPSRMNDPEHFESNIEKLQTLSCHEWCTKHGGARLYLSDGDMHIYMEKGKPKVAIRFDEDIIKEINGEMNDFVIPKEYVGILDKYMKQHEFLTTERVDDVLRKSKALAGIDKESDVVLQQAVTENLNDKKGGRGILSFFTNLFK